MVAQHRLCKRVVYKKWKHHVYWMFHCLLDFEANIQGMAEMDEKTIVYITLETLVLQRSDAVNSIYVRSHLFIFQSFLW